MKKQTDLKQISDNSLNELFNLVTCINDAINKNYLHVSNFLPDSIKKELKKFEKEIIKEDTGRWYRG